MAERKICAIPGCENSGKITRGWCSKHYQRWQSNGDPLVSRYDRESGRLPCTVDGCERVRVSRGLCASHNQMQRKRGTTEYAPGYKRVRRWLDEHVSYQGLGCLIWPFSVGDRGRGTISKNGVVTSAPRAMCIAAHGDPPTPSHEAAHSCGNGHIGCINPNHLRWATHAENEADKVLHGTIVRGEKVNTAKLSEDIVREIRRSRLSGVDLADAYGVSKTTISHIRRRKSWAWLD